MGSWAIAEAKNRFSELLDEAQLHGAQVITRHGVERAVVLSVAEYRALKALQPDFKNYLLEGPQLSDAFVDDLMTQRDADTGRDIEL